MPASCREETCCPQPVPPYEAAGDCVPPIVTVAASALEIEEGELVQIIWGSVVHDSETSIVTLEYDDEIVPLVRNTNGVTAFTPEVSTTYTVRAVTDCGTVTATVTVTIQEAVPCVCPGELPDCIKLDEPVPAEIFQAGIQWDDSGSTLWDGTLNRLSGDCRWGVEFSENINMRVSTSPNVLAHVEIILELISCDPDYVYELTFKMKHDGGDVLIWTGRSIEGTPFGQFTPIEWEYVAQTNFNMINCAACTQPTVRFDPPAGSKVGFPTLVFLHASIAGSAIYYGIDGGAVNVYTGPISLAEGQVLSVRAVSPTGCVGEVMTADYETDNGLAFEFLCDGPHDRAGVFDVFVPNSVVNDYHYRITATRSAAWTFHKAIIYETDSDGVWVTGQAWATVNPIFPLEMDPDPFAVFPLVLFNGISQVNSAYGDPVASYAAGEQVFHGFGQPFVALTGYFRLEFTIEEDGETFTIYKLIPHTCLDCADLAAPTIEAACGGAITVNATVEAGSQYEIHLSIEDDPAALVSGGISVTGSITYLDTGAAGLLYTYTIRQLCAATNEWMNSPEGSVRVPTEAECGECQTVDTQCDLLSASYKLTSASLAAIQNAILSGEDTFFGDCNAGATGEWGGVYTRSTGCNWGVPASAGSLVNYPDSNINVFSGMQRTIDDADCIYTIYFTCADVFIYYRKVSGGPVGEYNLVLPSPSSVFPDSIIVEND